MRFLTGDEQLQFREDYREKEREIQRNIAVYLSALVVAAGWIVGPQSRPIDSMMLGNNGQNVYAFMVIAFVNAIFSCFLTYKSIVIHEITQFAFHLSPNDSGLVLWEQWRNSRFAATRSPRRQIYHGAISLVPILVSILLLWLLYGYVFGEPAILAKRLESANVQALANNVQNPTSPSVFHVDPNALSSALQRARYWWYTLVTFHVVPAYFFWLSGGPVIATWRELRKDRSDLPHFTNLSHANFDKQEQLRTEEPSQVTVLPVPPRKDLTPRPAKGAVPSMVALVIGLFAFAAGNLKREKKQ